MTRVKFHTLGCKVNQYETQVLAQRFSANGFVIEEENDDADIYIVNSCTVTSEGDRKTRQTVRRLKREHPEAIVALTGCYPQAFPDEMEKILEADVVTGSKDREGLITAIQTFMATGERVVAIAKHHRGEAFENMSTESFGKRTRAFIKIEDGCENYCAYCIIPTARGPVRSKAMADLKQELLDLVKTGHREIVLAGINLSSYGKDLPEKPRMIDAIELACGIEGIDRVRLGSLEPDLITPDDVYRMSKQPKVCPQFHLSLQSGSQGVLERMGRHYTSDEYMAVVAEIRKQFKNPALTTDIMVGFPGESEEEHLASVEFAKAVGFAKIHAFSYSPRAGTRAAKMDNQVDPAVKKRRSGELISVGNQLRDTFLQSMVGTTQPVLFEERNKTGQQVGYTMNYTPIMVNDTNELHGQIINVLITGCENDGCVGIVV